MVSDRVVRYEIRNRIAWITLNRPEKRNAINTAMRKALQDAFTDLKHNADVWVAVLTGEATVFCAGKDLTEDDPEEHPDVMSNHQLHMYQMNIYKPFICALNGPCLAQGAGLAFNSDIVIMSERASFGWPQVKRGISSVSGPSRGAHVLPWNVAMGYLMRGRPIPAADCLRYDIANQVVPHDQLLATAERWAEEIMENAPLAVRAIKEAARLGQDSPLQNRMQIAEFIADRILDTEDAREGLRAFVEKRKPAWKAR